MEDELEERLFYQTYASHARLFSRASLQLNWPAEQHVWRFARLYLLRYEVAVVTVGALALFFYLQLHARLTSPPHLAKAKASSWDVVSSAAAAFALQGRRPHMEDRFLVDEDVRDTGVRLFAIFDGHGGEFAADFAKDSLSASLSEAILAIKRPEAALSSPPPPPPPPSQPVQRKKSIKKGSASTDDAVNSLPLTDPELLARAARRPVSREVRDDPLPLVVAPKAMSPLQYVSSDSKVDYGRLISDHVLDADRTLVDRAKKKMDVAGTTALIAVIDRDRLTVANVGDSRGVMCDSKGNAIPLSFDHKPQQMREQKRIKEAGGFIAFNGVWRVAGILATSRAMGDYPLKDKKYVIADPDVLTFDLSDHKPLFLILATDGLWDIFSNEEAVAFVKEHLDEPHFGAKSITMQSYEKGSYDNITVIVIDLRNQYTSSTPSSE